MWLPCELVLVAYVVRSIPNEPCRIPEPHTGVGVDLAYHLHRASVPKYLLCQQKGRYNERPRTLHGWIGMLFIEDVHSPALQHSLSPSSGLVART